MPIHITPAAGNGNEEGLAITWLAGSVAANVSVKITPVATPPADPQHVVFRAWKFEVTAGAPGPSLKPIAISTAAGMNDPTFAMLDELEHPYPEGWIPIATQIAGGKAVGTIDHLPPIGSAPCFVCVAE